MAASPEEQVLIELLRQGDEGAARQVVEKYLDRLMTLARKHIGSRMVSRVDEEEVALSALRSFFFRVKDGRLVVRDEDDLCKLLVTITARKTLRRVAFHKAAKRDPGKETGQGERHQEQLLAVLDREIGPDHQAAFNEQLERFLARLSPTERKIVELRFLGHSNEEIVDQLHLKHDRKIRRLAEHIREVAVQSGLLAPSPTP
jgi:RNA polymerase sigma-70 factor (ECF subfamily)